jgi:hypothetical protein
VRPTRPIDATEVQSLRSSGVYVNGKGILSRTFWIASTDALFSAGGKFSVALPLARVKIEKSYGNSQAE